MVKAKPAASMPLFAADPQQPRLMLMDGHAMLHRSFHAIAAQRHLTVSRTGEDVTGVFGFTNVFLRALQDWKPTYCAIAFDTHAPTFRHEQFSEYKAQRLAMPDELRPQFGRVKQLMTAFGVPIYEVEGYEADDVIGTLARQAEAQGIDVVILTGDRDTFQLISPRVKIDLAYSVQERKVYDEAELAARYGGLTPAQQPDFKALVGDSSDNIPGVPKIGEKRAAALLAQHGNLEGVYEHLVEIKPASVQQSLADSRDLAFANRQLMTINCDAPAPLDLGRCRFGKFDRSAVVQFLTELEFHSVIPRVPAPMEDASAAPAAPLEGGESSQTDYQAVQTEAQLEAMLAALHEAGTFAFDTETTSTDPMRAELVGLSFAAGPGRAWYVPVGHLQGQQLPKALVLAKVKPLLESPEIAKCAHNANYDLMVLDAEGIHCRNVDFDTMIAAHLAGRNALGLKPLALETLGVEMTPITQLLGTGRKQITFDLVDIDTAMPYAAADADLTGQLRPLLAAQLASQSDKLPQLLANVEMPLVPILVKMQRNGIKVEADALHQMARELNTQLRQCETQLYQTIGHAVNLNSPQQLSDLLFKELGLPKTKRTTTGYSTDANSLEGLKGLHPVVDQILDYRQIAKLKSTYVESLPELINPRTGRIHTSYNQTGSATGRISSSEPNLQNIPIRTELGRQVRKAFVAGEPDWLLFAADYSQIELRALAHISQAPELLDAFHKGEDIHAATASLMFDVPIHQVKSEMRRIAKILNFGVIYGLSPHGISQQTGFSREEGARFINIYFAKYPGIQDYIERVKRETRETQHVSTLLGRRRYLPEITSSNFNVRQAAERMAINMPIQGTAAEIMKLAMLRVDQKMQERNLRARLLLQVHDELVFETPISELDALKEVAFTEMPAAMKLDVPLKVEVKQGRTWGDME